MLRHLTPALALSLTLAALPLVGAEHAQAASLSPTPSPRQVTASWLGINSQGTTANWSGLSSSWDTRPLPAGTFGTVRWWDDTTGLSTKWCDIAPTPTADVPAALATRMTPKLDSAVTHGVRRVIIVVGHPAPWQYDAASNRAANAGFTPWFCGGERSSVTVPSTAWLGTSAAPGPGRARWSAYTSAVLNHIRDWNTSRGRTTLPFEVNLQVFNEPSGMLSLTGGVPNTATTTGEAAASLRQLDQILRWRMDNTPGLDTNRVKLLTSPLTNLGPFSTAYLASANSAQGAAYKNYPGLYDGVSFQTYSVQGSTATSSDTLAAAYDNGRIATLSSALDGTAYPRLGPLPRHQTETNHGAAYTPALRTMNLSSSPYTPADRAKLTSRLIVSGLRWNLTSNTLYTLGSSIGQYPTRLERVGTTLIADDSLAVLLQVRRWIIGHILLGCSSTGNVVTCRLRDPHDTGLVRTIAYLDQPGIPGSIPTTTRTRVWRPDGTSAGTLPAGRSVALSTTPLLLDPVRGPHGYVDSARCTLAPGSTTDCAAVTVSGWAVAANTPTPVRVDVYRDGPAGTGTLVGSVTADHASPDLMIAIPEYYNPVRAASSAHRYRATLALPVATRGATLLYAHAVDTTTGLSTLLNPRGTPAT